MPKYAPNYESYMPVEKFPEKIKQPYFSVKEFLEPYLNANFAKEILMHARKRLLQDAKTGYEKNIYRYDSVANYYSYLFNERKFDASRYSCICKTWAMCFILCHINDASFIPLHASEECQVKGACYNNIASRLEKIYLDEYSCPIVFLQAFSYESGLIERLFEKVENDKQRKENCRKGEFG